MDKAKIQDRWILHIAPMGADGAVALSIPQACEALNLSPHYTRSKTGVTLEKLKIYFRLYGYVRSTVSEIIGLVGLSAVQGLKRCNPPR